MICCDVKNNQECLNGVFFDKENNRILSTNRHVIYKADCDLSEMNESIILKPVKIPPKSEYFSLSIDDGISYGVTFYDSDKTKIMTLYVDIIQSDYVDLDTVLSHESEIEYVNVFGMSPKYINYVSKVFDKSNAVCIELYNANSCVYFSCESRPNEILGVMPCEV